ncbi:MAG TPA: isoamylase early set domain-containing protein [Gemmatimonadaceae bacterium]|nr:isoamylase early set domain-containing protein [Gemmatimonadaceae bacterium]
MSDHEHDAFINEIASELKRPVRFSENFDARVMSAIRTSHLSVVRGERAHATSRHRRVLFPALASLAAAALVFVVMRAPSDEGVNTVGAPGDAQITRVADAGERVFLQDVTISVFLPKATSVAVMGAFNDWDAARSPMVREKDGTWTITLRLLPGSYEYQFLTDGSTRMTDPTAPATDSEFGEANSVLTVTPRTP